MDIVKSEMSLEVYKSISPDIRQQIDIRSVEPKEYDYSSNEKWKLAKINYLEASNESNRVEILTLNDEDSKKALDEKFETVRKAAITAYYKLKKIEYEIRNNKGHSLK